MKLFIERAEVIPHVCNHSKRLLHFKSVHFSKYVSSLFDQTAEGKSRRHELVMMNELLKAMFPCLNTVGGLSSLFLFLLIMLS